MNNKRCHPGRPTRMFGDAGGHEGTGGGWKNAVRSERFDRASAVGFGLGLMLGLLVVALLAWMWS